MKHLKIYIGLLSILVIFSCKKEFLERTPPTSLTPTQALSTEADLQVALRGAYTGLRATDFYGRTVPVIGDVMADNVYQSSINTNRYTVFVTYQFTINDGNVAGLWNNAYATILRANNIINSNVQETPAVSQYKGEAHAIRALSYFTLIRYFARPYTDDPNGLGVPIVSEYNPDAKPPRNKISEVYALINDDLNKAVSLMGTGFINSSQFSKYAARGLQAKVYLTMGDMANAKTAALDVINNGGFSLLTAANYKAYWDNPAPATAKGETLFEVSSDAVGNNGFDALSYLYSQAGNYGDLLLSDQTYALFAPADVRKSVFPTGTRGGSSVVFVEKYPSITGDRSDTKVLRLSDIYLIAAEASLPNSAEALGYLNAIRTRRNAPAISSTGSQLFEDIIAERRIELAAEGDRYMDLQRLKRDVVRGPNFPASARLIPYTNFRRILPIPQAETDANPNVVQNPGY